MHYASSHTPLLILLMRVGDAPPPISKERRGRWWRSASQGDPPAFSNASPERCPSSTQFNSDSIEAEERAKEQKRRDKAEKKRTRRKRRKN
ncbi:hypothetical protein PAXINDRAFT_17560 [Paxillus involutus ATCC 200175]|uniref:Unplaced genomic scaffold PAXINscaffold_150, whole genome shotgun sequence n=1 Tax=Paxillus involutus ATCC 200175 TaxID=664439 RepID=A0A0C9TND8_PAXIN|nr:hypothetical protein PAXINDRAFT_17560 [Paxillus involutus ATCC 200175]